MTDRDVIMSLVLEAMDICHDQGHLDAAISAISTLTELDDEEKQQLHDVLAVSRARLHEMSERRYWEIDRMLKEQPTVAENVQVAIKPCPFCGMPSQVRTYGRDMPDLTWVECTGCRMRTMDCCTKEEAVGRWNRRASE